MENKVTSKNVLIIGHKGYIGTILTDHLLKNLKDKINILGIDLNLFSLNDYFKKNLKIKKNFYKDCRNFKLKDIKLIPDVIIYLAAVSNDPMGREFKDATKEINFLSCVKFAKEAKQLGVKKFIFASSCSMYGSSGNTMKKENDKLSPLTDYARSKVNAEKKLKHVSSKNFKVISLRFATAAGLSNNLRLDLVFNDFVANAIFEKKIVLLSSGKSWRPLIHVNDISKVIKWSIFFKPKKNFLPLNIGSKKWNFRIIDLAYKISALMPGTKVLINNTSNHDKRSYKVNFGLYKKLAPNHQPSMNFKKAVNELANFLKKEKNNLKNFRKSPKWSRLARLKYLVKNKKINKRLYKIK
jgi:nucleoside-diphosphate-sugar epimerase